MFRIRGRSHKSQQHQQDKQIYSTMPPYAECTIASDCDVSDNSSTELKQTMKMAHEQGTDELHQEEVQQQQQECPDTPESSSHCSCEKSVTFSDYDEVFDIPHIYDLTQDEVDDVWYSEDDFDDIRYNCSRIIKALSGKSSRPLDKSVCVRGLEQHSREYSRRRKLILKKVYDTVAEIQSIQTFQGVSMADLMAELCIQCTSQSVRDAQLLAMNDSVAAICS